MAETGHLSSRAVTKPHSPDTRVRLDTSKNRKLMFVSLALAGAGLGLLALGWSRDWGFLAMFWTGVLAIIGVGWIVGLLRGGGVATAKCPHCGARLEFTHIASSRTEQCEHCGEWCAGTKHMVPLAPDHIAEIPVFPTPLPEGPPRWLIAEAGLLRCPMCAAPSTRMIAVQATSVLGDAFAALSPISVQRVHSLRVPACPDHDDGVMLDMDEDDRSLLLLFRSYAYYREFVGLNAGATTLDPAFMDTTDQPRTLSAFLATNPRPLDLRAPVTCPKHGCDVLTAMGWVTTMDVLPSHDWLDAAADHPVCLSIGHHRARPDRGKHVRQRIAWCPTCEAGMNQRWANR